MPLNVVAISGSLRRNSYTTALLRAAFDLAPDGMKITLFDGLAEIPPYNEDDRAIRDPAPVEAMRRQFAKADALIFATPEYNRSFSGVLKNALDWLSRPPHPPLEGKAALVLTASPGMMGGGLANYHLRQTLSVIGVHVLPGREFAVSGVAAMFDDSLELRNDDVRSALRSALSDLKRYAVAVQSFGISCG